MRIYSYCFIASARAHTRSHEVTVSREWDVASGRNRSAQLQSQTV